MQETKKLWDHFKIAQNEHHPFLRKVGTFNNFPHFLLLSIKTFVQSSAY